MKVATCESSETAETHVALRAMPCTLSCDSAEMPDAELSVGSCYNYFMKLLLNLSDFINHDL